MYLIDGNNLLYAAHAHMPGPPIGREQLCRIIGRWAARAGASVTVVFDGPHPTPGLEQQMNTAGITVTFSVSRSADEVIEETVTAARHPTQITVVTSDKAIQSVARPRKCRCLEAHEFVDTLCAAPSPPQMPAEPPIETNSDEKSKANGVDHDDWLRRLGIDPDERPDADDWMIH